jgi:general secretion pathway protein D
MNIYFPRLLLSWLILAAAINCQAQQDNAASEQEKDSTIVRGVHEVPLQDQDPRHQQVCLLNGGEQGERIVVKGEEEVAGVIGALARPITATDDPKEAIEINFDNTDLQNVLNWVSDVFKVNFLADDAINPQPPNAKIVGGNKITFKTQRPLTKRQVWDLFVTFLDLFGLSIVKGPNPDLYKVVSTDPKAARSAARSTLTAFLNVHWSCLPNSDERIRYIYFIRNSTLATLQGIVDAFRSNTGTVNSLPDLNAFVLTDRGTNVRSVMQIVEELDSTSSPEALSVLKLVHADAEEVKAFYDKLTQAEDPRGLAARILGAKKAPSSIYFPDNTRVFAERRTNTLIILGTQDGIHKVEDFIINYVDTEIKVPYSPLYVYELQYTKAEDIAAILSAVTKFAPDSAAAQSGGVRDGDKYLRPMTFQAEPSGNRLLISAEKEDYLKVLDIIKKLDVMQPQIALEVLVVNVTANDDREFGVQIRNKGQDVFGHGINAQNSGLPLAGGAFASPVVDQTTGSLLANLITLAQNQTAGATLISISNKFNSVWALFKLLETQVHLNVISNPFLVTVNNYAAQVSLGTTRRVLTGQVQSQLTTETQGDVTANLTVNITPLINSTGNINLQITINVDSFTDTNNPSSATRDTKSIKTNANVGNGEVLAIGGLLQTNETDATTKIPILGDIPLLGWLFKNKTKVKNKDNLLVFISPRIVEPRLKGGIGTYSQDKADHTKVIMSEMRQPAERRDIIHRWFFYDRPDENNEVVDNYIAGKNQQQWCNPDCINPYYDRVKVVDVGDLPPAVRKKLAPGLTKQDVELQAEKAQLGINEINPTRGPKSVPAFSGDKIKVVETVEKKSVNANPVVAQKKTNEKNNTMPMRDAETKVVKKSSRRKGSIMNSLPDGKDVAA